MLLRLLRLLRSTVRGFHLAAWLLSSLVLVQLVGCAAGSGLVGNVASAVASTTAVLACCGPRPAYINWKGLLLFAEADVNKNSAIAVDILFVKEKETLDKLVKFTATQWFAQREDWIRTFPEDIVSRSYELVPGQSLLLSDKVLGSPKVAGILLFANYATPGDHRARMPAVPDGGLVLLSAHTFNIVPHPLQSK